MPTLKPQKLSYLEDLSRKYRIDFPGELGQAQWPECHENILRDVKELGNKKYDVYATTPALLGNDPWKMQRKAHAMILVEAARRSHGRSESSWRFACEPFILSRLSSEVCCRDCRKRVWRSEIEVRREETTSAAVALENRQAARQPCRCPRERRSIDHLEAVGLNPIFNFRADEEVHHSPQVAKDLGKGEKPDRVYGLRQTRNIELFLYDIATRQSEFADQNDATSVLQFMNQPMNPQGDRQLFPFLVLEAKKGSSDDWHSINMQTAFSIRTFLETQSSLFSAASIESNRIVTPLVWFFSNRGEDWRLSMAYTEDCPTRPHCIGNTVYRIIDVWRGCITSQDGALQLLLLVDYIFDWARDLYRDNIIRALKIVASGNSDTASGFYSDSNIFSTRPLESIDRPLQRDGEEIDLTTCISAQEPFLALDSPAGVFRHATFVESVYRCLFITRDNVQTLLKSTAQSRVQQICRLILGHMSHSIQVDPQTLISVEEEWTGSSRSLNPLYHPHHQHAQGVFYMVAEFTTYLSAQWHQVRELSIIAIAVDAWEDVVDGSKLKKKSTTPFLYDYYDKPKVLSIVKKLKCGSTQQILNAAITRTALRVVENFSSDHSLIVKPDSGSLRNIVHYIYDSFRRGILEPEEPFLRGSKRLEQQHLLNSNEESFPFHMESPLCTSEEGCVLITATCAPKSRADRKLPTLCVYLTEGNPDLPAANSLGEIMKKAFETRDVYHTTRSPRSMSFSEMTQRGGSGRFWNLTQVYGVYSDGFGFLNLLYKLGSGPPISQGASQSLDECGAQLYRRNLSPWRDHAYIHMNSQSRMFILHKLFTRDILFWRNVAKERESGGIPCCRFCAALGVEDMCEDCLLFLDDDNQYDWFQKAVVGERPLEMKDMSAEEVKERLRNMRRDYPSLSEDILPGPHGVDGYDGNTDWAKKLDFYPGLDEPFKDIAELHQQWRRFVNFCNENGPYNYNRTLKRKQSDASHDDEDSDITSNNL